MKNSAIYTARKAKNLTQAQLADRAKISTSYMTEIENGTKPGSVKVLNDIASALGLELKELFDKSAFSKEELELLSAFSKLSTTDQSAVVRHAVSLARDTELRRIVK